MAAGEWVRSTRGKSRFPLARGSGVLAWAGCLPCAGGPAELVLGRGRGEGSLQEKEAVRKAGFSPPQPNWLPWHFSANLPVQGGARLFHPVSLVHSQL